MRVEVELPPPCARISPMIVVLGCHDCASNRSRSVFCLSIGGELSLIHLGWPFDLPASVSDFFEFNGTDCAKLNPLQDLFG